MAPRRVGGVLLALMSIVAGVVLDRSLPDPMPWVQLAALWGAVGVVTLVGLVLAILPGPPSRAETTITSVNQSGGITAHTVNNGGSSD